MHIAIEGCLHGELEKVYATIAEIEQAENINISLLLCCGDFQSMRNLADLRCMAVPDHYKELGSFWKYYGGVEKAPLLTIFIGGNHEASNFLQELPYGGWVAPNIYYLGYTGVVDVNGLKIGGLSGIFKGGDYLKGRYECTPYDKWSMRSVYHVRNLDVFRLKQMESSPPDIMMSHDWPRGIHAHGNTQRLLARKKHFAEDVANNALGSGPAMEVLETLKPQYWFAGHLHVKFAAVINHGEQGDRKSTKFLALDKCLPSRGFLQILTVGPEIGPGEEVILSHDPKWLAVLKATNHLLSTSSKFNHMPFHSADYSGSKHLEDISQIDLRIHPDSFKPTAAPFDPTSPEGQQAKVQKALNMVSDPDHLPNPQTQFLCKVLEIDDPIELLAKTDNTKKPERQHPQQQEQEQEQEEQKTPEKNNSSLSRLDLSSCLPTPSQDLDPDTKVSDLGFEIDTEGAVEDDDDGFGFVIDTKGAASKDDSSKTSIEPKSSGPDPPVKKLKRRNVAMYKSEDSD